MLHADKPERGCGWVFLSDYFKERGLATSHLIVVCYLDLLIGYTPLLDMSTLKPTPECNTSAELIGLKKINVMFSVKAFGSHYVQGGNFI